MLKLICAICFLVTIWAGAEFVHDVGVLDQMQKIDASSRDLLIALLDAETGQRGYIITGNQLYLSPYQAALQAVKPDVDALANAILGTTETSIEKRIRALVEQKMNELQVTIEAREHDPVEAVNMVNSHLGKNIMQQIREGLNEIELWASSRHNEYQVRTRTVARVGFISMLVTFILGSIILVR